MVKRWLLPLLLLGCGGSSGPGTLSVHISAGPGWLHPYPLFLGLHKQNGPQLALWLEDENGRLLRPLFATRSFARQRWWGAPARGRPEALPHFASRVTLPLPDAYSGATPRGDFSVHFDPPPGRRRFVLKAEVNHSLDWNAAYPENARPGTSHYSGGPGGSGQPALVYALSVDLDRLPAGPATLLGASAPAGGSGALNPDSGGVASARQILGRLTVERAAP